MNGWFGPFIPIILLGVALLIPSNTQEVNELKLEIDNLKIRIQNLEEQGKSKYEHRQIQKVDAHDIMGI